MDQPRAFAAALRGGDNPVEAEPPVDLQSAAALGDPKGTRANILAAGRAVFAEKGYSGAKVNEIVERAQTTKPMIYYHYGSKEGLFAAVLEDVYAGMRAIEASLDLSERPPVDALRTLIEATFDYHAAHPDWIRLITVANIEEARLNAATTLVARNSPIMAILGRLLDRGARAGAFRGDADPLHIHLLINSFSFYRVSNRHTWKAIFGRDLGASEEAGRQRAVLVDAVMRYLQPASA